MIIKFAQGNKVGYDVCKWIVEEESEISNITKCAMGSTVYVIHTGESWMLDNAGTWYPITNLDKTPIECNCIEELTIWSDIPT